jgi:hypothetical protein
LVLGYLAFAIYVWCDFVSTNHDGLANLGLIVVTAPVALIGLVLSGGGSFALIPEGHGYLTDHAIYYVPAVSCTALLLWLIGRRIERAFRSADPTREDGPPGGP